MNMFLDPSVLPKKTLAVFNLLSQKDFIDLYCLLPYFTLPKLFVALKEKYTNIDYNEIHILKSLVYFTEANEQPMPRMLVPLEWAQVKKRLRDEVGAIRGL